MNTATVEFFFGIFFAALWLLISCVCFSRIKTLLVDRHHPFASPLASAKVLIMILLGLWAFFYGALREFELFSPDSTWHITPVCLYHIIVAQVLRPFAVMLFCFVISTPALPHGGEELFFVKKDKNSRTNHHMQSPNGRLVMISTNSDKKFCTTCLNQVPRNNINSHNSDNVNSIGNTYYSMEEMADYNEPKMRKFEAPKFFSNLCELNSGGDSLINPINLDVMCNSSNVSAFSAQKPPHFYDNMCLQRESGNCGGGGNCGGKNNRKYSLLTHHEQQQQQQQQQNNNNNIKGHDEENLFDLLLRRGSYGSDVIPASSSVYENYEQGRETGTLNSGCVVGDWSSNNNNNNNKRNCKSILICCSRVVFYWIIGRIPPISSNNNNDRGHDNNNSGGGGGNCNENLTIIDHWSRLLIWRLALRMRLYVFLWLLTIMTSIVLTVYVITGELRGCFERVSEVVGICYSSGIDTNSKARIYIPRGITCLSVINNSLLLLLWVTCGVSCLRNIGNIITKESFTRTYIMGAFLFALHIIYECVQLYDQLRYNEIVKVLFLIFENICDCTLVLLLALRLGNGSRQMPQWYKFFRSLLSLDTFKKSCGKYCYVC